MNYVPAIQTNTFTVQHMPSWRRTDTAPAQAPTFKLPPQVLPWQTPDQLLRIIAIALNMDPNSYRTRSRRRSFTDLRFIGSMFLRRHFPELTLQQVAQFFGGQDHTSVINGMRRAQNLLQARDPEFLKKYKLVLKAVERWIGRGAET